MKCFVYLAAGVIGAVFAGPLSAEEIDFNRQIRPLLSKNCFACHGRDAKKREAKLRLDTLDGAIAKRDDGPAIVPGKSIASGLVARINSDDPDEKMPPADSGKTLTADEIKLLTQWIDAGAKYDTHWSFTKPVRPALPKVKNATWTKNSVDHFASARLEAKGLRPSAEADRHALIRRLSLDLTGLPPTPEQVAAYVTDKSPAAYEKLVDQLLASPHYGERWARMWMDLGRYADTQGYEKDNARTVWTWRDWLISALNDDMPYDQFTTEMIAGDLLPKATPSQVLATVFHRNTMTNTEGGTDDEEYRVAAIKDRIDTTGLVWLGLSVGCGKCHSHKYDPISQKEYYGLYAFFNQTADADRYNDAPRRALPSAFYYQKQAELLKQRTATRKKLAATKTPQAREAISKQIAELQKQLDQKAMAMKPPAVPIMKELPANRQRKTRLLVKGDFLNPADEVTAGVPSAFHPLPKDAKRDRLALARWLMDKENPLTARVAVNRIWARMFGVGLVETEEDFGTQGELPSHPQLLDWLAEEFRDTHKWSRKKLCKTIVMSATYRQSSHVTPELVKADPRNRLLSRGPRFRLEAEMIRDQALAVSGLLSRKMYGPPVMPLQPDGIWKTVYSTRRWVTSKGDDRHRRGLYTFAKRTSGYPSFLLFDGGSGETCMVRRIRTNTATAALVTLNDPVYTEAAQALARRIVSQGDGDTKKRAAYAWQLATGRPAKPAELARLAKLVDEQTAIYAKDKAAAKAMATVPLGAAPEGMDESVLAAWTVAAGVLLNLDETLTKG